MKEKLLTRRKFLIGAGAAGAAAGLCSFVDAATNRLLVPSEPKLIIQPEAAFDLAKLESERAPNLRILNGCAGHDLQLEFPRMVRTADVLGGFPKRRTEIYLIPHSAFPEKAEYGVEFYFYQKEIYSAGLIINLTESKPPFGQLNPDFYLNFFFFSALGCLAEQEKHPEVEISDRNFLPVLGRAFAATLLLMPEKQRNYQAYCQQIEELRGSENLKAFIPAWQITQSEFKNIKKGLRPVPTLPLKLEKVRRILPGEAAV